jgi:hypothetical protein
MSILKGILHHWNKTNSAYDTIHPETESAQVTDWNQGIVNTLASTALGGLVNTLTSDSLLAKMIQKVLEATGVKYSLSQNGYVCFGSLVGGLIIQWVINTSVKSTGEATHVVFPVAFQGVFSVAVSADTPNCIIQTNNITTTGLDWRLYNTTYGATTVRGIVIGK